MPGRSALLQVFLGVRGAHCLPTKLCFLLSHSGAARTPLATKAKKAFLTWRQIRETTHTFKFQVRKKSAFNENSQPILSVIFNINFSKFERRKRTEFINLSKNAFVLYLKASRSWRLFYETETINFKKNFFLSYLKTCTQRLDLVIKTTYNN